MTTYTYSELETLWLDAAKGTKYATDPWAELMAAIAEAESGGDSEAKNPSGATGIWQILGAVSPSDQSNLTDPTVNAHEALLKLESQGLGAWTTYTSGAYKSHLQSGVNPSSLPTSSGGGSPSTGATTTAGLFSWPSDITGFFADAKSFTDALLWLVNPSSWLRIGAFGMAVILLLLALYVFVRDDKPLMPQIVPVPV
jgi:hypothetical protein